MEYYMYKFICRRYKNMYKIYIMHSAEVAF